MHCKALLRTILGLFCAVLLILSAAGAQPSQRELERASRYYLEGVKRQNLGTLREAARMYEAALRVVPHHAASYYRLSGIARMVNEPETALRYARRAYEIDSLTVDYADNYARMLTLVGEYGKADTLFTRILEHDPSNAEAASLLALIKLQDGELSTALQMIDSVEVRGGIRPVLVDAKRTALIRQQRYGDAYDYMTEVCHQIPEEVTFRIQLAELAAALYKDSVALVNYHAAIELDSTAVAPQMALAEYYRIKEQYTDFLEALVPLFANPLFGAREKEEYFDTYVMTLAEPYRRYYVYMLRLADAVRRSAENDDARAFYVRMLLYGGQLDMAHDFLMRRIDEGGAPLPFYRDIIELAQYREEPDTVAKYLQLAKQRFPRDAELGMTLLFTQFQNGDTLAAIETARQVIRYSENDSITSAAYGFCGDMAHLRGDNRSAYRDYRKALALQPDNPLILNNFAYYLSIEGRKLDEALEMAHRANQLDAHNPTYLDTEAWVLYRLGRYEEAQTLMRQALVLDTANSAELLLHYGDILFALGKSFMAKNYWQKALEAGARGAEIEERLRWLDE